MSDREIDLGKFNWQPGDLDVDPPLDPGERRSPEEIFAAMSNEEQDRVFGPEVAQAIRDGELELSQIATIAETPAEGQPGYLVAKPSKDLLEG